MHIDSRKAFAISFDVNFINRDEAPRLSLQSIVNLFPSSAIHFQTAGATQLEPQH
jgi:hypothetical protein